MSPTIRMCLIRDDLTTVWCEVTSSIRDRAHEDEVGDEKATSKSTDSNDTTASKPVQKELLLCLRPIRDGDKKVDESLRFCPRSRNGAPPSAQDLEEGIVSSDTNEKVATSNNNPNKSSNRPPKKRVLATDSMDSFSAPDEAPQKKRSKHGNVEQSTNASDTEKSVVESLLKMNKSSQ